MTDETYKQMNDTHIAVFSLHIVLRVILIIYRNLKILNCLKCVLILVKLSLHLNQKYPSVLKYYGKITIFKIFSTLNSTKKAYVNEFI